MSIIKNTNTFYLDNNKNILFFNIFIKNNKLYLITPIYKNYNINKDTVKINYNSNVLQCFKQIRKLSRESCQILIYNFNYNFNYKYNVEVSFKDQTKVFTLKDEKKIKKKKLSLTTLFKTDYKLNEIFYDYYKKQGVEHFYMYYNGIITDEIKKYYNKEDITLIEWDYLYRNKTNLFTTHHAQPAQLHDAIYRFGKDNYDYMIFCDLDEYINIKDSKLIDLVSDINVDTFGFKNIWANTKDNIVPNKFPNKFYISKRNIRFPVKSKCIHKLDSIEHIGVHSGTQYNFENPVISTNHNYKMYHFHSWGGQNVQSYSNETKKLKIINDDNEKIENKNIYNLDSIQLYILNWEKVTENSLILYELALKYIKNVKIVNCDKKFKFSDDINIIQQNNDYNYGEQYNTCIKDINNDKILGIIAGNTRNIDFKTLFNNLLYTFNNYKTGIYTINDKSSCHVKIKKNVCNINKLSTVENSDCGIWFINPQIHKKLKNINYYELSPLGWGIDIITVLECEKNNLFVIRDYSLECKQIINKLKINNYDACKQQKKIIKYYNDNF